MKTNIVLIVWLDALTDAGWKTKKEVEKLLDNGDHIVRSVGVIVSKDKQFVYLCADFGTEGAEQNFNRTIAIPAGWIKSTKTIHRV